MGGIKKKARWRILEGIGAGLLIGAAMCLLVSANAFESVELLVSDALQRGFSKPHEADRDIVLVVMDQGSIEYFQESLDMPYPWPRSLYGEFVRFIDSGEPRAMIFDMLFAGQDIDRDEILGAESDQAFADAIDGSGRVTLGASLRPPDPTPPASSSSALLGRMKMSRDPPDNWVEFARVDPLADQLISSRAHFGFVNAMIDHDGLVRRARLLARVGDRMVPSLTLAGLMAALPEQVSIDLRGLTVNGRAIPMDEHGVARVHYHGPGGGGNFGKGRTYPYIPIANLLRSAQQLAAGQAPQVDPESFRNKWVLIGSTSTALFDQKATPFSPEGSFPGIEIQAAVLDNLLNGDFLVRTSRPIVYLLVLLAAVLVGLTGRMTSLLVTNLVLTMAIAVGFLGLSVIAFASSGIVIDLVSMLTTVVAVFVVNSYLDFVRERRQRMRVRSVFQFYLDPHVVRGLLETPGKLKLGGERRHCTVFFSDIVGFTSMAEGMEPERLVELMNRFLGLMTDSIIERGGFVDKYIGDAVMAVFGAPADLPEHALAACQATLDCHERLQALGEGGDDHDWPNLRVRIGLNTGDMIVGNMGSEQRMNYTVMGDTVNLGSRLEGANNQFGTKTMVGPRTAEMVGEAMVFRELDLMRVKGKKEPVHTFELVCPREQANDDLRERLDMFAQSLAAYRQLDFAKALDMFQTMLKRWPDDSPSETYLKRCQAFMQEPPPPDWDGVFVMTGK